MSGSITTPAAARDLSAQPVRPSRVGIGEVAAIGALIAVAGLLEFLLRHLLTRPFWGDEGWRAYDIAMGTGFLHHLNTSGAPLAPGWLAIEDGARALFGSTESGLRLPMFLTLPGVGVATYVLARRWLSTWVAAAAAMLLVVNSWVVNNALQLKSYTYEALFPIAAVGLYLLIRREGRHPAALLGLYVALGLTCVFSVPNLFVVGPLLALDLAASIRSRRQLPAHVAGEAVAAGLALGNYAVFIRPQSGVANTAYWVQEYAPHHLDAFVRFTVHGVASFFPGMVTGVAGVTNATPAYALPAPAHALLAVVLAVLLIAGIAAAVREAAGRALVVAAGGAVLLELIASVVHRWPFGMQRVSVFLLPLLYILMAIGAVRLARLAAGHVPGRLVWWRYAALGIGAVALVVAGAAAGVATSRALAQTIQLQYQPTKGSGYRAAAARARALATPGDMVVIKSDEPWYGDAWLYYMDSYHGYPAGIAAGAAIPAANTISVMYVTPAAIDAFLRAHPHSPTVFLLELTGGDVAHRDSLRTLRGFGYCATRVFSYPDTGRLTMLTRSACAGGRATVGGRRTRSIDRAQQVGVPAASWLAERRS
jgi:4-amino-4-deoxy-L-arabinose transferase-like glycosyltransferase